MCQVLRAQKTFSITKTVEIIPKSIEMRRLGWNLRIHHSMVNGQQGLDESCQWVGFRNKDTMSALQIGQLDRCSRKLLYKE